MNSNILVSVIMSVYNTPQSYLDEAVKSILNQTHKNFELFVIDDGSEKDLYTGNLFENSRIKVIRFCKNCGIPTARNTALDVAKGKYVAIMDSDDVSEPTRLEKQVAFMEVNPDVVVCGTWFRYIGEKSGEERRDFGDNKYYRACLFFGNAPTMLDPSTMIRKSVLDDIGFRYDERLKKALDYQMWVKLSHYGLCVNLPEVLFNYRVHPNQISTKLRTDNVSEYDWIVLKEQYDEMGLELTAEETDMLRKNFRSKEVDPIAYRAWLDQIVSANVERKLFDQTAFKQRVEEQWETKVQNIMNILDFVKMMNKLPAIRKSEVLKIEGKRIRRKLPF